MKYIVPIVSGKGGVGKSTVASNLAVSLANQGFKVALIDADFYGPSVPVLFGGGKLQMNHNDKLIPCKKFGVKYISIGFFLEKPDDPIIWRGPMFNKALLQLFNDVDWGDIDITIVDMPPGTGDAQISLAQNFQLTGAIVVTTPQEVAVSDVRKLINMLEKVKVPVLGLVENMSGFKDSSGEIVPIFGKGGGESLSKSFNLPLLANIPLEVGIREGGDSGKPVSSTDLSSSKIFDDLALKLIEILDKNAESNFSVEIEN